MLYLVSTPIGNLNDITLRAIETLKKSDYILCEDTRVSKKLLDRFEIKSNLISNHKFNEKKNLEKIVKFLNSGKISSLISDAGTPSVSNPGSILINECIKNEIKVLHIPGPSAVGTAGSIMGFSDHFLFLWVFFLEKKKPLLKANYLNFSGILGTLFFFWFPIKN
jgi:Predicted methyltransferases